MDVHMLLLGTIQLHHLQSQEIMARFKFNSQNNEQKDYLGEGSNFLNYSSQSSQVGASTSHANWGILGVISQ